jgi:hypothetical protein
MPREGTVPGIQSEVDNSMRKYTSPEVGSAFVGLHDSIDRIKWKPQRYIRTLNISVTSTPEWKGQTPDEYLSLGIRSRAFRANDR